MVSSQMIARGNKQKKLSNQVPTKMPSQTPIMVSRRMNVKDTKQKKLSSQVPTKMSTQMPVMGIKQKKLSGKVSNKFNTTCTRVLVRVSSQVDTSHVKHKKRST